MAKKINTSSSDVLCEIQNSSDAKESGKSFPVKDELTLSKSKKSKRKPKPNSTEDDQEVLDNDKLERSSSSSKLKSPKQSGDELISKSEISQKITEEDSKLLESESNSSSQPDKISSKQEIICNSPDHPDPNTNPKVIMSDGYSFEILKLIGRGDVSRVYLVKHVEKDALYAMKVMSKLEMVTRKKIHRVLTEREILITTNHPFVVTMYYSFQSEHHLYFIMDYCAGAEFFLTLRRAPEKRLPENIVKFYMAEVLSALEYLHMLGIVYRDLKPENILLHESGHIMLSDFNLSKQAQVPVQAKIIKSKFEKAASTKVGFKPDLFTNSFVGTAEYIAPEVIEGSGHDSSVDWWTCGILLHEMLFGRTPFKGQSQQHTFDNIKNGSLKLPDQPLISKEGRDLVKRLLVLNPKKRLGFYHGAADIKTHRFFNGVNWALLRNETPPIIPKLKDRFDTSYFRLLKDDQEILAGEGLSDEVINADISFSSFTTVNKDLNTNLVNRQKPLKKKSKK